MILRREDILERMDTSLTSERKNIIHDIHKTTK
jgi:hypothetical protein